MIRLSEDPKYGFAVGRVRALEVSLLDRPRYERFTQVRGADEFAGILAETVYGRSLDGGVTQALDFAERENEDFLRTYALDEWLVKLANVQAIFGVIKAEVKKALAADATGVTLPGGIDAVTDRREVDKAVADTLSTFSRDRDPAAVDMAFDRLMHQIQLRIAGPSEFMVGYLKLHADIENLRTLVRLKSKESAGQDASGEMRSAFLDGGTLSRASLLAAFPVPWTTAFELLGKAPPYGAGSEIFLGYITHGYAALTESRSFTKLERLGREAELRYLRQTRYANFGHEPLVAFFFLRRNELLNLRLLYAASVGGLASAERTELVAHVE